MTTSSNQRSHTSAAAPAPAPAVAAADSVLRATVGPYDVLCGRSAFALNNVGNRRFRVTVSMALKRYMTTPTRTGKTKVIDSIVATVRASGGRFLKWRHSRWVELDGKQAREKVGHALRDMTSGMKQPEALFPRHLPMDASIKLSFSREAAASLAGRSRRYLTTTEASDIRHQSLHQYTNTPEGSQSDIDASSSSQSSSASSSAGSSHDSIDLRPPSPIDETIFALDGDDAGQYDMDMEPLSPLESEALALLEDDDAIPCLLNLLEKSEL